MNYSNVKKGGNVLFNGELAKVLTPITNERTGRFVSGKNATEDDLITIEYMWHDDHWFNPAPSRKKTMVVRLYSVQPIRELSDLTTDELMTLRGEIRVGSDILCHYENSFGVYREELAKFCDCYIQELEDEISNNGLDMKWYDLDSPEKFAEVYNILWWEC